MYAEQPGDGTCRRTRGYDALFAGGQIVALERTISAFDCGADDSTQDQTVMAGWLDDGSLARYVVSSPQGSQAWDRFNAAATGSCRTGATPPAESDVEAVTAEAQRLREAFLAP